MIKTREQAAAVQARRRARGLKGRAKAVRRWYAREYFSSVDVAGPRPDGLREELAGDFTGCRPFNEVYPELFKP